MLLVFLILLIIGACAYFGYRAGAWGTDKLNETMRTEINLMKAHNRHWSAEARNKYELSAYIAQENSKQVSATMYTVIQLLQTMQKEQGGNLSALENEKINQLINQAKQVTLN